MKRLWLDSSIYLIPLPTLLCFLLVTLGQGLLTQLNQTFWHWILLDSVALTFLTFIAILGTQVYSFALRNLNGDRHQIKFLFVLGATLWSVQGLAASGNFALFFVFWILISAGLHQLLQHFRARPGAVMVAKEKFVISRIGDLALIAAAILIFLRFHTLNFAEWKLLFTQNHEASFFPILLLLMIGALTKSAQVPFHAWLPRTLEAPTSVSALMHAGIINAGGYLLIRTYSLVSQSELVLSFLILCGLVSTVWGVLAMQMQADIKRRLAWSTVGQMGFMMIEIGLGLPGLALLHLIGHGFYKADAFLSSGYLNHSHSLRSTPTFLRSMMGLFSWLLLSVLGLVIAARISSTHLLMCCLVSVLLLPLIHFAILQSTWSALFKRLAIAITVAMGSFWLGLQTSSWFELPEMLPTEGFRLIIFGFVIFALLLLSLLSVFQPWCQSWRWYRWLYASGLHGFGFGRWPESIVDQFLSKKVGQL
jgi:NADH:ubiquinone oxidoreductase subunit 5 (subunit L)/multisubunit Na+/H+ antiporter MnhA subunit